MTGCIFSPNGNHVAASCLNNCIYLCNVDVCNTGQFCVQVDLGVRMNSKTHRKVPTPAGSGSWMTTLKSNSRQAAGSTVYVSRYIGHYSYSDNQRWKVVRNRELSCRAGVNFFGNKGKYVISGSDDGRVHMWEKDTEHVVRILESHENEVQLVLEYPAFSSSLGQSRGSSPSSSQY